MDSVALAEELFKELIWKPLISKVITKLIISLGLGPTGFLAMILTEIILRISEKIFFELKEFANLQFILLKNEGLRKEYVNATISLKQIALSKGEINIPEMIKSKEFLDAREKHKQALADFLSPVHVG